MGIFDHSSRSAFVRSHTDVGWEGLALALIHPNVFYRVEVRTLCRPVKFIHTKLSHPCLYAPCFVHWCTVMLEQEGAKKKRVKKKNNKKCQYRY